MLEAVKVVNFSDSNLNKDLIVNLRFQFFIKLDPKTIILDSVGLIFLLINTVDNLKLRIQLSDDGIIPSVS